MIALEGTYYNGKVKLSKEIKTNRPVKVIVTFLEEKTPEYSGKLTRKNFNFDKSRRILNNVKTDFSDAVIDERRNEV